MRPPIIGVTGKQWKDIEGLPAIGCRLPYLKAIENAGGVPFIFPLPDRIEDLRGLFENCNGLLLTGGDDIAPEFYGEEPHAQLGAVTKGRDEIEFQLTRWALAEHKPILGICRGCQVLNVAAGGSLVQDIASQVEGALEHVHPEQSWYNFQH